MLRWICDVPAAIVNARKRRRSSTNGPSPSTVEDVSFQHPQRELAELLARLAVRELDHERTATRSSACRLGDVALGEHPERVELRRDVAELAPVRRVVHVRREILDQTRRVDQVAHECGAALERQGHVGDPPAVVLVADAALDRHPHLVEEELRELRGPEHGLQRPYLDAGQVHRQHQPGDAVVLLHVGVGAHEQLAEVADLTERAPDLLTGHHVVIAVADGPRAERSEVGAGLGLREALAPDLLAAKDLRQVRLLLCLSSLRHDRGPGVQQPHEVHPDVRRAGSRGLFEEDELLARWCVPTAVGLGPAQPGVPALEEAALPVGVPGSARRPVVAAGLRCELRELDAQPGPQLGAELLVCFGIPEVHAGGSLRRTPRRPRTARPYDPPMDLLQPAETPEPPYWAVIFTSTRHDPRADAGYDESAVRMLELAHRQPGFLGVETGEGVLGITVSYWQDEESIRAWKAEAEHLVAQQRGRAEWYERFELRVARVERAYGFMRATPADRGGAR